jgi:MBG domain (YGX type)/NHL repeat
VKSLFSLPLASVLTVILVLSVAGCAGAGNSTPTPVHPTLTVTASNASRVYGAANPTFTLTATGAQNGDTFTLTATTTATSSSPAGTYSIVPAATGANLANYTVNYVNGNLTVSKAALTVTAADATRIYGAANPNFTASVTGALNGDTLTSSGSTVATLSSSVGTYPIVPLATGANLASYDVLYVNGTLTVAKAVLTVTPNNQSIVAGSTLPTLTATTTGFVNADGPSVVAGVPSLTTSATTSSPAGFYPITAALGTLTAANYSFTLGAGTLTITLATNNPGAAFTGKAMAGTKPIAGASVRLYAAGTSGNGSAGTPLTGVLTTDATGAFSVPAGYSCPAPTSQLYLIVQGGQVGTAAANSAITLATAVGSCNQLAASYFLVNEVTTVATVWGLAQFLGAGGNVGTTTTNAQGLTNAFATVANLANLTTGTSPGALFPANGSSPAARVNSLANLLNTCTSATSSSGCSALFSAATPASGTAPANTLDAALNLALNPGTNVAALYTQSTASTAFASALTTAPSDWTMFINYTGGGMNSPSGLGIDAAGNVWVASYFSAASEFTPAGNPVFPNGITTGGLFESYGLAIDAQNNVWIPNQQSPKAVNGGFGTVTVLNPAGRPLSGTDGYSAGGLAYPTAIAIDTNGTAWVADNYNSRVTLLSSTGNPLSGANGYTSPSLAFPVAVAVDANHNGWIANPEDDTVTKVSPDGTQFNTYACCIGASGVAIDQRANVWVANYYGDSISQLDSSGTIISSGYSDNKASIWHPQGIAVDGSGHVWITNYLGDSITELAGSATAQPGQILSPSVGYASDAKINQGFAIAIDASGNLWITNFHTNVLTEIVGLATPVKTPQLGPVQSP